MTSSLNTALKSEYGYVGPGWRRWVRARDAAYAGNTRSAKLFFERRSVASGFGSLEHVYVRSWKTYQHTVYTCSEFCYLMHAQLCNIDIGEALHDMDSNRSEPLARKITCFVCRREVRKDGSVDETKRIDFWDPEQELIPPARREVKPPTQPHYIRTPPADMRFVYSFMLTYKESVEVYKFLAELRRKN